MRRYSAGDEEKMHMQALVLEWERSGLLDSAQAGRLNAELRVELRRTNGFLRGLFFFFTAVIVTGSVLLLSTVLGIRSSSSATPLLLISALVFGAAAEYLAGQHRLYHFGIEEACAAGAVVLLALAAPTFAPGYTGGTNFPMLAGMAAAGIGAWVVYQRFGHWYAAAGSLVCIAAMPWQTDWPSHVQRLCSAAVALTVFLLARSRRAQPGHDFRSGEYGIIQAAGWAGMYLVLNLHLGGNNRMDGPFYWFTYAAIWMLPAVGLYLGLRDKERALMGVNLAMALATLATNKPYLGLERQAWDPILLGIVLVGTAVLLRRWLARGAAGQRYGFTPFRILDSEKRLLATVNTASAAFQPQPLGDSAPAAQEPKFGGGSSGGGGATSDF